MSHIGICVSDWERSLRFYRDVLGFQYAFELAVKGEPSDTLLALKDVALRAIYLERDGVRTSPLRGSVLAMMIISFSAMEPPNGRCFSSPFAQEARTVSKRHEKFPTAQRDTYSKNLI